MPAPFPQTLRALHRDRLHRRARAAFALLGVGLALAWSLWFFLAEVGVKATSTQARLESTSQPRQLTAGVGGVVVAVAVSLGQAVEAGELLVQLDDTEARLALAAQSSRCAGLGEQSSAARAELSAQGQAGEAALSTNAAAIEGAGRAAVAADEAALLAAREAERATSLGAQGHAPEALAEQRLGEARQRQAEAQAQAWKARQQRGEATLEQLERQASLAAVQGRAAALSAEGQACEAQERALEHAVAMHRITAPSDGVVGSLAALAPGVRVEAGAPVAAVVPVDALHAVATFPLVVAGRIEPGSEARIRLDGFPWSQYGTVPARVEAVASEPDARGLRVELALVEGATSIPLSHGLPGVIEVDLERLSPAQLALRAAGQRLMPTAP